MEATPKQFLRSISSCLFLVFENGDTRRKKTNKFNCYEDDVVEKIWSFDTGVKVLYKQMIQKKQFG